MRQVKYRPKRHLISLTAPRQPRNPISMVRDPTPTRIYAPVLTEGDEFCRTEMKLVLSAKIHIPKPRITAPRIRNRRLKRNRKYLVTFRQPDPIFSHLQDPPSRCARRSARPPRRTQRRPQLDGRGTALHARASVQRLGWASPYS